MSENGILANIFRMGDQVKRNLRDFAGNPGDYLDNVAHQNNIEWKKDPVERSMGFFNPVPLGNVSPFMLRKQMKEAIDEIPSLSRRDFMKKSAGLAAGSTVGAGVTAKLLRKFAPEERAVAKQAALETAPKYKYNSLKEYLDDAQMWAKEDFKAADLSGQGSRYSKDEFLKRQLLTDEMRYNNAKLKASPSPSAGLSKEELNFIVKRDRETLNMLSPQAKKEMKAYKEKIVNNTTWSKVEATPEGKAYWKTVGDDPGFGDNVFPQGYDEYSRMTDVVQAMKEKIRPTINWADYFHEFPVR